MVMSRVYIESTIPSYLVARPSRDVLVRAHQLPHGGKTSQSIMNC